MDKYLDKISVKFKGQDHMSNVKVATLNYLMVM